MTSMGFKSYLSDRNKTAWCLKTAKKKMKEFMAVNKEHACFIEPN